MFGLCVTCTLCLINGVLVVVFSPFSWYCYVWCVMYDAIQNSSEILCFIFWLVWLLHIWMCFAICFKNSLLCRSSIFCPIKSCMIWGCAFSDGFWIKFWFRDFAIVICPAVLTTSLLVVCHTTDERWFLEDKFVCKRFLR